MEPSSGHLDSKSSAGVEVGVGSFDGTLNLFVRHFGLEVLPLLNSLLDALSG